MPRWAPLTRYLLEAEQDRLDLSLGEIEGILGGPLPASARRHRTIVWSNSRSNPYARIWRNAGYRTALRGLTTEQVAFIRDGAPPEAAAVPPLRPLDSSTVVLVGCVKTKADRRLPARDLYRSPLFQRRRAYAERSAKPWFVLSAAHGLVHPDEPVEPYDLYLAQQSEGYAHDWARRVVEQLRNRFGPDLARQVFELHASAAYALPLTPPIERAGATVLWPFEGLTFGEHLRWYRARLARTRAAAITPSRLDESLPAGHVGKAAHSGLARQLTEDFSAGRFELDARLHPKAAGWVGLPEVAAAAELRRRGADDVGVRLFCTFLSAMERGSGAGALWERGTELYLSAPWVYDPSQVVAKSQTVLCGTLRGMGVSRRDLADAAAWRVIAEALTDAGTAPEVHGAVYRGVGDASALLDAVARVSDGGTPLFPLLRDPGIAPLWVRLLAHPGAARISSLGAVPLTVDAQVRKASEYLDVSRTDHLPIEQVRPLLQKLWREDVERHGAAGPPPLAGTCAAVQPALWFVGEWGCTWCERVGVRQPIGPVCSTCRFDEVRGARPADDASHHGGAPDGGRPTRTTARQEILAAARELTVRGTVPFSPAQVIGELRRRGTGYPDSTLRTHIVSTMCVNAPGEDSVRYPDLVRVGRGQYRLHAGD